MDSFHITLVFYVFWFDSDSLVWVYLRFSKAVYASTGTHMFIKTDYTSCHCFMLLVH